LGCHKTETGLVYSQSVNGIMGFGMTPSKEFSLVFKLFKNGIIDEEIMSFCFGSDGDYNIRRIHTNGWN